MRRCQLVLTCALLLQGEDGLVAIEAPMVAVFVLPRRENDPTSSTVKVALEMKVTAEVLGARVFACSPPQTHEHHVRP